MRNTKMKSLAFAGFGLLSLTAFAGDKSGNGGVVFLCPDRVKLVDFWESEDLRNPMRIGDRAAPLEELTDAYLERMSFYDESRARVADEFAHTVLSDLKALALDPYAETKLVRFTDGPLNFSLDSDEVNAPAGCEKAQAVTQKQPEIDGEKLLTIYRPIWDRMDNEMRVFTIFHEIDIRALLDLRAKVAQKERRPAPPLTSTRPARLLNQWIGSPRFFANKTVCDYRAAEARFGMLDPETNTYGGFTFASDQPDALRCDSITRRVVSAPGASRKIRIQGTGPHANESLDLSILSPVFDPHSDQWLSAGLGGNYGEPAYLDARTFDPGAERWDYLSTQGVTVTPQADGSILAKDLRILRPYGSLASIFHGGNNAKDRLLGTADLRVLPDGKFVYTRHEN